jgi:hypothetical protein
MSCHFLIENFDCETTSPDKCIQALKVRIYSSATPEEERKYFDSCAEEIGKKDSYRGAEARALIKQSREPGESSNEIKFFSDHLPTFKYDMWQSFIRENRDKINAFRLCRYLKGRWNRLEPKEKSENIPGVEQIIHLVGETFQKQRKRLHQSLKIVSSDIMSIKLKTREDEIRGTIKAHKRAKRWEDLNNYIAGLNTAGFSYDLIMLLNQEQSNAEEGVLWLHRREILDELVGKSANEAPDTFYSLFKDAREDLRDLVENQTDLANQEQVKEVEQLSGQLYMNILNGVKAWEKAPEVKFHQMKQWQDELLLLKHSQPGDWETYFQQLSHEMVNAYAKEFFDALKTGQTIDDIKQAIDRVLDDAARFGLKEKLDDYIAENQVENIFEIRQHLDQWIEFDRSLERVFTASDPFNFTIVPDQQPEDLERVSGLTQRTAVFGKIRKKYRISEEIIQSTRTNVKLLESLVAAMKEESKNILFNKPILKLEGFDRQFKAIEEKITRLLEEHGNLYKFIFLQNLKNIIGVANRLLFSRKKDAIRQADKELLAQYSFLKSINDCIASGGTLIRDMKQLKSRFKSHSAEGPAPLQDEFFRLITDYRDKELLFTRSRAKEAASVYESLMEMIHAGIGSYLKPVKTRLDFPFPLIEQKTLEELKRKTGSLLKQIKKIDRSHPGFEELVETYKDELEQWDHIIDIQEAVRKKKFDQAAKIVETTIYDPDIRYPAQILVYYYRYLFGTKWKEEEWLNFFSRFSMDSIKTNESGYQLILKHYRKGARKNFKHFSSTSIETHYKVFNIFFPSDDLGPYLVYLCRQGDTNEFLKDVQRTPVRAEAFKAMVILLEKNEDWKKYMALYYQSPAKYKKYFEKPVTKAKKKLEGRYNELIKAFENGSIKRADVDAFIDGIPEDRDFQDLFGKSNRLRELYENFHDISANFKSLSSEDIWIQDDFYRKLYRSLERHTDKFTGDFAGVRDVSRWGVRIAALRNIYDLGRQLKQQMDKLLQIDSDFKIKAEEKYSEAFRSAIKELLSTWNRFSDEIAHMPENAVYKDNFQHYYLAHFIELWKKMSLYHLCEKAKMEPPRNLDKYVEMWERILENHERFMKHYNKKDGLHMKDLGDVKVLDEFIRLTIDRLKQQGRLKKRGEV